MAHDEPLHAKYLNAHHMSTELGLQRLVTPEDYQRFIQNAGIASSAEKDKFALSVKYERATDGRCTSAMLVCTGRTKTSSHKCGQAVLRIHSNGTVSSLLTTDERVLLHERHVEDAHGREGITPHFADMAKRYGLVATRDIDDDERRKRSRAEAASDPDRGARDLGTTDVRRPGETAHQSAAT